MVEKIDSIYLTKDKEVALVNEDQSIDTLKILSKFGNNNINFLVLSNNKMYLTDNPLLGVTYKDEIKVKELFNNTEQIKALQEEIDNLKLILKSNKIITSYIEYLVDENIVNFDFKDLDRAFNINTKRWVYFSEALNEFIELPKDWQRLPKILRKEDEVNLESGETVGILESEKIYNIIDNQLIETTVEPERPGTEYLVLNDNRRIIYTERGYLII